jgi:hypothetical protein
MLTMLVASLADNGTIPVAGRNKRHTIDATNAKAVVAEWETRLVARMIPADLLCWHCSDSKVR